MNVFSSIVTTGTGYSNNPTQRLGIQLSNIISLILFSLTLILFVLYYQWYGWNFVTYFIPGASILPILTLLLNHKGLVNTGRVWLGIYVPVMVMFVSVYAKYLYYDEQQDLDYFTFRFLILASCVFPPIIFSLRERGLIISTSLVGFILLICFDPIHRFFGVPFPHKQLNINTYYFTNVVVLITYVIMGGAVAFLKRLHEKNERNNQQLIQQLNIANEELKEKNEEIEEQAMELLSQSEALNYNQKKLQEAYYEIEKQKSNLHKENIQLESELLQRNQELTNTNSELIKHNNELRQFSYTISHNLRGPVASLLGLTSLLNEKTLDAGNNEIIQHVKKSTERFDGIIKDLSKIIDIRNDIFKIRQRISLEDEVNKITSILDREIKELQVKITGNYKGVYLYSVKPMISSILYNLISNAIKYRSLDRSPDIEIDFKEYDGVYKITVLDNGLGINMSAHGENIFRLYKRFHQHTEGKGLGLYLVKLQAEALGGNVFVESELNRYTKFIVSIKTPQNVDEQILAEESAAKIFYDAVINATGIIWKEDVDGKSYRSIYKRGVDFMNLYNTPNWITDMRKQGTVNEEEERWLLEKIIPGAYAQGLRRVAGITPNSQDERIINYQTKIKMKLEDLGIKLAYFTTYTDARAWLLEQNEVTSS